MKRTIKIMSLLFLSIITLTTFSSCEGTIVVNENELIGTWEECYNSYDPNYYLDDYVIDGQETLGLIKYISFLDEGMGLIEYQTTYLTGYFVYPIGEESFTINLFRNTEFFGEDGCTIEIKKISSKKLMLSCKGATKEYKKIN
jgi:hypothetical protein